MDKQLNALFENLDLKAKSLLITVWGDCVAPHGGTVWLRSLINLVEPLGLNDRMVRTAVFRLQRINCCRPNNKAAGVFTA